MSAELMIKQANAALRAGAWAEAERRYKALIRVKPLWGYHNLGALYLRLGRRKEAEAALRQALRIEPDLANSQHSLSLLLLAAGRYAEAWPLHEARRRLPELKIANPRLSFPEWQGEELAGKRLLVIREQGLGDQIQMARFMPELAARGAQVILLCDAPLAPLFEPLGVEVVAAREGARYPAADYWTLMFSMPQHLGLTLESLSGAAYLAATASTAGGVGVKARGGTSHQNDRYRSLPGDAANQLLAMGLDLDPAATGATDFLQTANIVAGLDLVISVDTSVAHLAAAMGKPTWILLPAVETDWRWLCGSKDSPWYASVRLYRQATPGKWGPVLRQVAADLAEFREG